MRQPEGFLKNQSQSTYRDIAFNKSKPICPAGNGRIPHAELQFQATMPQSSWRDDSL